MEATCAVSRVVISRTRHHRTEGSATFFIVQMHKFLKKTKKGFLFFRVERLKQPPAQETPRWKELLQKRGTPRREAKQAKASASGRHGALDEPAFLQAYGEICGG